MQKQEWVLEWGTDKACLAEQMLIKVFNDLGEKKGFIYICKILL